MKRLFLIISFALLSLSLFSQSVQVKDVRQTYLWDVTLSMKGKVAGCPDIWDKVKKAMISDIQQINDETVEIVVIPFQHKALNVWREMATPSGKSTLIANITKYQIPLFNGTTTTNLYAPLQYVADNILTSDKVDILKLMTDGVGEVQNAEYEDLLKRWCSIAKEKDAYGFYIMLTDAAKEGLMTLKKIDPCRFEPVDVSQMNGTTVSVLALAPQSSYAFNVRDDYGKDISLKFTKSGAGNLPSGYKVHIYSCENPYIQFDEVVEMQSDYTLTVKAKYLMSQQEMILALPIDGNERIFFKAEPAEGMEEMPYATTQILDNFTTCEMINKPEKTVRFHVI